MLVGTQKLRYSSCPLFHNLENGIHFLGCDFLDLPGTKTKTS